MVNFLGIGAQKAGTTWIARQLSRHPDIYIPEIKELHFWDRPASRSLGWWIEAASHPGKVSGEITPAYAFLNPSVINEVKSAAPHLRIFISLRNPIERAWSGALMALRRAELEYAEASPQWFIDHFNSRGSRLRGDYETAIRNWRAVFGHEAMLILWYRDISERPRAMLKALARHIGADPAFFETVGDSELNEVVFKSAQRSLPQALRQHLVGLYADQVSSLSQYLGVDLQDWLEIPKCEDRGD